MKNIKSLDSHQLKEFLLCVAPVRSVFIWGAPGIGKSTVVNAFATELGFECVNLIGSQLAPEDIIGIPKIEGKVSRFYPPSLIYREKPFVLFIDEINIASPEVQKSFYSLILESRAGEYTLPEGSIVIGAGNRTHDGALAKKIPSALINRMVHVEMRVNPRSWLDWAQKASIHPLVIEFISTASARLSVDVVPVEEVPFSTPRSWEFISDSLTQLDINNKEKLPLLEAAVYGCLSEHHAGAFLSFLKSKQSLYDLNSIIKGDMNWPAKAEEKDVLMDLALRFAQQIAKELPVDPKNMSAGALSKKSVAFKTALRKLSVIDADIAKLALISNDAKIPDWFMIEVASELPRLMGSGVNGK